MKKIFCNLLFTIFLTGSLVSCTTLTDDYDYLYEDLPIAGNYLNPPAWIQGKWSDVYYNDSINHTYDFDFKFDDMKYKVGDSIISYKTYIENNINTPGEALSIIEVANDSVYKVKIAGRSGLILYDFQKTSDSTFVNRAPINDSIPIGAITNFKRYNP